MREANSERDVLTAKSFAFEDCTVAYYEGGPDDALPLLLMHGVGPGASVRGAFVSILPFLVRHFHVFAMDLVGFGGSSRKPHAPYFDFELWVRQAQALVGRMLGERIALFGHSLSGAIALRLAASTPRVAGVITTATVGTRYPFNPDLGQLWTYPASRAALRESLKSLVFDVDAIPQPALDVRWSILSSGDYRSYFSQMFATDRQALMDSWVIPGEALRSIAIPVTLVHGRDDRPCPAEETSLRLAAAMPRANVVLLSRCGHAPAMEHPHKVIAAVELAFGDLVQFNRHAAGVVVTT
ncbi:MAG TPA: alpha/beta hydrolase [Casimicrobiaceae bacterium]|nr:alpha/beta hydrolase [Casimicrobiaceae bacterium]